MIKTNAYKNIVGMANKLQVLNLPNMNTQVFLEQMSVTLSNVKRRNSRIFSYCELFLLFIYGQMNFALQLIKGQFCVIQLKTWCFWCNSTHKGWRL